MNNEAIPPNVVTSQIENILLTTSSSNEQSQSVDTEIHPSARSNVTTDVPEHHIVNTQLSTGSQSNQTENINVEGSNEQIVTKPPDYGSLPPDYQTATELPSYEEAERIKREGGEFLPAPVTPNINSTFNITDQFPSLLIFSDIDGLTNSTGQHRAARDIFLRDAILGARPIITTPTNTIDMAHTLNEERSLPSSRHNRFPLSMIFQEWRHNTTDVIGSDTAFLTSFLVSFIFNWIGFLFALCVSQTIAGRCGALSGFGLSIIKWTFIVKHSLNYASAEIWLWWILIILGALLFCKGCIQYLQSRPYAIR